MDERHEALARRFKEGLEAIYGPRLRGLYACQDDDEEAEALETVVVLDTVPSLLAELDRTGELTSDLALESAIEIGRWIVDEAEWRAQPAPSGRLLERVA